jgi:methylmalonyl-CoA mutase N-terminal domain/subunit
MTVNSWLKPGCYPFTARHYRGLYRDRLWFKSSSRQHTARRKRTNEAFKDYLANGQTELRLLADLPIQTGIDPDHPSSWNAMLFVRHLVVRA